MWNNSQELLTFFFISYNNKNISHLSLLKVQTDIFYLLICPIEQPNIYDFLRWLRSSHKNLDLKF